MNEQAYQEAEATSKSVEKANSNYDEEVQVGK